MMKQNQWQCVRISRRVARLLDAHLKKLNAGQSRKFLRGRFIEDAICEKIRAGEAGK